MKFINILKNARVLSVSVVNTYSEHQLIDTFLDNFHQYGKYSSQIYSHQAEFRREGNLLFIFLSILSLQTDYLHFDSSSGCGRNSERVLFVEVLITLQNCFKSIRK